MEINELLEFVRFDSSVNKQEYVVGKKDFATLQAEGVTKLINILDKYQIALLADEVGMGKTFQALAIIAYQFKLKPNSKVLVITPRKEVLNQWKNEEYREFREKHLLSNYKNLLPENESKDILELPNFSKGLLPLSLYAEEKIVFAKSTSFSTQENLVDFDKDKNIQTNRKIKLHEHISQFDLIVVDEAHKFRNYDNFNDESSLIIQTAKSLFSKINQDAKVLLMTATPLHSRKGDLKRITDLFKKEIIKIDANQDYEKILMENIMIRRLRVMSNGQNKYSYRNEIDEEITLTDESVKDYKNELFFAMLQKEYANRDDSKDLSNSKNLLDFLEGTNYSQEFFENDEIEIDKRLKKTIKHYRESYNSLPTNKKYETVLKKILNQDEKSLVFVRRTASAYELARGYIEEFDQKTWIMINKAFDKNKHIKMPQTREEFENLAKKYKDDGLDDEVNKIADFFENLIDYSKYKEFLNNKYRDKNERYLTAIKKALYEYFKYNEEYKEDLFKDFLTIDTGTKEILPKNRDRNIPKSLVLDLFKKKEGIPSTHASRFLQKFSSSNSPYSNFFEKDFVKFYAHEKYNIYKDDIRKLVKSAVLHSSIGLIELYCCDIEAKANYDDFIEDVTSKAKENKLIFINEVNDFLEHFETFKKYLRSNENIADEIEPEEDKRHQEDESIFYDSQPAYPYVGSTKNKTVITRFNSPFFPKLLCGTSTLQEGLNLHLFCNKVYHFGAAHTMGDDEQRVGRVDRLMGKMDRELKEFSAKNDLKQQPALDIFYPYLKSTFDEYNLKKMLCNKRNTEKLIDKGTEIVSSLEEIECDSSIKDLVFKFSNEKS